MFDFLCAARAHAASTVRTAAAGILAAAAIGTAAQAGDLARPEVIGFSLDGQFVAFEEYGEQDGSGYPYASVYVIDVAANAWVPGSPVHVMLDLEDFPELEESRNGISMARAQAMDEAQAVLDTHGIVPGETGTTLIYHPMSDLQAPTHEVEFSFGAAYSPYSRDTNFLYLSQHEVPSAECDRYDLGPVSMMTLELEGDYIERTTLQQDSSLPASRGCSTGYRIHSVVVYAPNQADQHGCCHRDLAMLVLLQMSQFGFEGPDWRTMGVTAMLNEAW